MLNSNNTFECTSTEKISETIEASDEYLMNKYESLKVTSHRVKVISIYICK